MADVDINEALARAWVARVQAELDATEKALEEVRNIRITMPGEGDTLFEWISKVSEKMESVWTNTCQKFKQGWAALQEALKTFSKNGQVIESAVSEVEKTL